MDFWYPLGSFFEPRSLKNYKSYPYYPDFRLDRQYTYSIAPNDSGWHYSTVQCQPASFQDPPQHLSPLRPWEHNDSHGSTMTPTGATPILRMNVRAFCECVEVLKCSGNGLSSKSNPRLVRFFRIHPTNGCRPMSPRAQDGSHGSHFCAHGSHSTFEGKFER